MVRLRGETSNSFGAPEDDDFPDFDELFNELAEWERCLEGIDFKRLVDVSNDNPTGDAEVRS
ncbi:MAG: hypothetical protein ROR55_28820 [Devosia sp.]